MQVLSRRTKNNPVLIGEPGVGKTAIVEGLALAHRQRRRAGEHPGQEAARARHGGADRRGEVPRRVRGAAEGGADRGDGGGGRDHPLHRRDAHAGRRGQGGGGDGRLQPAEAGAGAGRAALRRRDDARRVPQAHREGRGAGAAVPAGVRQRADGRGHHLDPARDQGEVRGAPRGAHHRLGAGGGGDAVAPLHRRPVPAGQGDRPDGRGGEPAADGGRFEARGARRARPRDPAEADRGGGAEARRRTRRARTGWRGW